MNRVSPWLFPLLLAAFLTASCKRYAGDDISEGNHPMIVKAKKQFEQQDLDGATATCKELLKKEPGLARAHLELGFIYSSQKDWVRCIYHYTEYLELRPDSPKRTVIEQMIADGRAKLAHLGPTMIPDAPGDVTNLLSENETLRRRNQALEREVDALRQKLNLAVVRLDEVVVSVPQPSPTPQTYVVRARDTLSSIAEKVYGDPKAWKRIYDANIQHLPRQDILQVGQTLVIPAP